MQGHDESAAPPPAATGVLAEVGQLGSAFKRLLGAQWQLLAAEYGLARSALSWILLSGLVAIVSGMGLALGLLALLGLALATWWGSWLWALLGLCALQLLLLLGAAMMIRRCMHWMSLPRSRSQWSTLMQDALRAGNVEASMAAQDAVSAHKAGEA